jgi:hypothetical protein
VRENSESFKEREINGKKKKKTRTDKTKFERPTKKKTNKISKE